MIIARNTDASAVLYAFGRSKQGRPSYGVTLRLAGHRFRRPLWRSYQVGVYGPVERVGRGAWTLEAVTWRARGLQRGQRVGMKAFIRVKIGLGGDHVT